MWLPVISHSLSCNQEFYNDGAFVYDPQTGRYGFKEGYSEEELVDDLVNKEEDHLPKGDAEDSLVVISEGQVLSVEFEKEEGTGRIGGPKESDEGSFDYSCCQYYSLSTFLIYTHLKV